jgi:hypothetical protein
MSSSAAAALSLMVLGAALSTRDDRSRWPWLLLAIVVQPRLRDGADGLHRTGPGSELFACFTCDLSLQRAYGQFVEASHPLLQSERSAPVGWFAVTSP